MVPVVLSTASERLSIGYDLEVTRRMTSRTRTSCIRCESRFVQGGEDVSTGERRLGAGGRGRTEGQGFFRASSRERQDREEVPIVGPLLLLLFTACYCCYLLLPCCTCYKRTTCLLLFTSLTEQDLFYYDNYSFYINICTPDKKNL